MKLLETSSGELVEATIVEMEPKDFHKIKRGKDFVFDWSLEEAHDVYKICLKGEETKILGLLSLIDHPAELRIHISLIEVIKEHIGKEKILDNIAGCLIGFACGIAFKKGYEGFVSLFPKTRLIDFYQEKYGFRQYGRLLALEHEQSKRIIDQYLGNEK
jgi:hypothetical protein